MLQVAIEKQMPDFLLQICFSCENASLLALTGPSGAGKTTLIRILAGLERADRGRISLNGTVWFDSEQKIFLSPQQREVGYVFQEHTLFPHMSIAENISFIATDKAKALQLLHLFHIAHVAKRKPHQISGGERQRAAFAQALAREPKILLLDEPFSALDPETRTKLQQELVKLKKSLAMPVIHVTHDKDEAEFLADSMLHVDRNFSDSLCSCPPQLASTARPAVLPLIKGAYKFLREYLCVPLESEARR